MPDFAVPAFHDEQAVYCQPSCPFETSALEAQLDSTTLPIYVVYHPSLAGRGDPDEVMRRDVDDTIRAWQNTSDFDSRYGTVLGLAVNGDSYGVWVTPGSQIQAKVRDWTAQSDARFAAMFEPKARVHDYTGALLSYTAALDDLSAIGLGVRALQAQLDADREEMKTLDGPLEQPDRWDVTGRALDGLRAPWTHTRLEYRPGVLAQADQSYQALAVPARAWTKVQGEVNGVRAELRSLLEANAALLAEDDTARFDVDAVCSALDMSTLACVGDAWMEALFGSDARREVAFAILVARRDELRALVDKRQREADEEARAHAEEALGSAILGLGIATAALWRRRTLHSRRQAFRDAADACRDHIARARASLAELQMRGEGSEALHAVAHELDALETHVGHQEHLALGARVWNTTPLATARAALPRPDELGADIAAKLGRVAARS